MKAIGFLDANGVPTELYKAYRDQNQGRRVLGKALKDAYADLFLANTKAHELAPDKLRGIVATKTSKGERLVREMVNTFKTLAKAADFTGLDEEAAAVPKHKEAKREAPMAHVTPAPPVVPSPPGTAFHYNIQIHLPTTTDITVYNAIFKSLKEHLL